MLALPVLKMALVTNYDFVSYNPKVGIGFVIVVALVLSIYLCKLYTKSVVKFTEEDEKFLENCTEFSLRLNLKRIEIKEVAERKGLDEERLKYHCLRFTDGKTLNDLDMPELAKFLSYVMSLNELVEPKRKVEGLETKLMIINSLSSPSKICTLLATEDENILNVLKSRFDGESVYVHIEGILLSESGSDRKAAAKIKDFLLGK